jgi:hypothetical protein
LADETTANFFFVMNVVPLVSRFVREVDGAGARLVGAALEYGARPDAIWGGRVHVEVKSARVLLHHATEILDIAKANDGSGSALELSSHETDARSTVFKVFLPTMITTFYCCSTTR